jgi:hypothetical protein
MGCSKGATTWEKAFRGMSTRGVDLDSVLCDAELASIQAAKLADAKKVVADWRRTPCNCPECRIKGKYLALHRPQDCVYRQARAALVPEAERRTLEIVGPVPVDEDRKDRDSHGYRFTAAFAREMDRLARPLLNGVFSNGSAPANAHVEAQSIVPPEPQPAKVVHCFSMRGNPGDDLTKAAVCFL